MDDSIPLILIIVFILSCYFSSAQAVCALHKDRPKEKITAEFFELMFSFFFVVIGILKVQYTFSLSNIYVKLIIFFSAYLWFMVVNKLCKRLILKSSEEFRNKWYNNYLKFYPILSIFTFFFHTDLEVEQEKISEKEILEMINASSQSGTIEESQHEYIENIFDFDDKDVEEICTHRSEVINLDLEDSDEEWHKIIMENRHTFYPVFEKDEDDVVGVLDTRDYFRLSDPSKDIVMTKAVDKPFFVPENMMVDDLLKQMQLKKNYFAIVLDEYGGMTGIVTLHDIVETIVGEIYEEDEEEEPADIIKVSDTKYIISGIADLEEVQEELNLPLPVDEYETFGGYVLGCYGRLPEDGTKFDVDLETMHIHITNMKNHRIDQMIVYLKEDTDKNEE